MFTAKGNIIYAMVRWICKKKITDHARMSDMHRILGIKDLESTLEDLEMTGKEL